MGGKKKTKAYVSEAFEYFSKCLEMVRQPGYSNKSFSGLQVDIGGLQRAVQALPKEDRQNVEKFWGLTGGPNHSKKLVNSRMKDIAYYEMRNKAILSLRKLLTLDYIKMYDTNLKVLINSVSRKVDKNGSAISDIEIAKFLMAFTIYIDNGPKMSFEEDPMSIDTSLNGAFIFDEYEVVSQICEEIKNLPDETINLRLLTSFFEMVDFQEMLVMKKSTGIEIIDDFNLEDVEVVKSVTSIRKFKERMFPYGAWEVTTKLIMGNAKGKLSLDGFKEALNKKKGSNWVDKIELFKTTQKKELRTSTGIRVLDIYQIGGLEFTDPREVDFLYLYGELAEV